jgi:hypothetical protein
LNFLLDKIKKMDIISSGLPVLPPNSSSGYAARKRADYCCSFPVLGRQTVVEIKTKRRQDE